MSDQTFIGAAKAQTMLRDFDKLRVAVRNWDAEETEKAFEKCERWIACINPTAADALEVSEQCAVVKPLEWGREDDGSATAESVFGLYAAYFDDGHGWMVILDGSDDEWAEYPHDDFGFEKDVDAIAACNLDYKRRILSALTIRPASEVAAEAEARGRALALKTARDTAICCKSDFAAPTARIDIANAIDALHTPATRAALKQKDS